MVIKSENGLSEREISDALGEYFAGMKTDNALIIPPDYTRLHSGAGVITRLLRGKVGGGRFAVMPALGTHEPMSEAECLDFFGGSVDYKDLIVHNWRTGVEKIGTVPGDFVASVSEGLVKDDIDVEIGRELLRGYDIIVSVGQVVPHEVVGMANYTKNIFVGCGGSSMINSSHMLGAFYGLERIMGETDTPVRSVFDYAQVKFLSSLPIVYILTVTTNDGDGVKIRGLYIGTGRDMFELAAKQSREVNVTKLGKPQKKVVVYLGPKEFKSTWLGNKAVYRTRKMIADGGELIILAPGVSKFGEDAQNDALIRKYGYVGRLKILETVPDSAELRGNLSVAAHLIHGSGDGRFGITYCTRLLSESEIEGVGFKYRSYDDAVKQYDPETLRDGFNTVCGEEIYYISNPALGLWTL